MKVLCAVVSVFALVTVGRALVCPDGWTKFGSQCFIYQSQKVSFDNAIAGCKSLGGVLAEPDTKCKNEVLVFLAKSNEDTGIYGPYIGGRRGEGNEFKWVTSPQPMTFTYWGAGEPNNNDGEEDCLHYWELEWNDIPCRWLNAYFCQKDAA